MLILRRGRHRGGRANLVWRRGETCLARATTRRATQVSPLQMSGIDRSMDFLRMNPRPPKPRKSGVTEIRGPYYTPLGTRYLTDLYETAGGYVNSFKFGGRSFAIMPTAARQ